MTSQTSPSAPSLTISPETPEDGPAIEALLDQVFGPGRFTKVSERVREFATFAPAYSFCARQAGRLLGSVRQWRVRVGDAPVVFLGPLAVRPDQRLAGVGGLLVDRGCAAAAAAGETCVLLVGDGSYFSRMGFSAEPAREVILPGPVDQRRVLVRFLGDPAPLAGPVRRL
jgi:predicted N-acetyltransferase YhbS